MVFRNDLPNMSYVTSTQTRQCEGLIRAGRKDYTPEVTQGINEALKLAAKGLVTGSSEVSVSYLNHSSAKSNAFCHIRRGIVVTHALLPG